MRALALWFRAAGPLVVLLAVACASDSGGGEKTTSGEGPTDGGGTNGQGTRSVDGSTTSGSGGDTATSATQTSGSSGGKDGATDSGAGGGSGRLDCTEINDAVKSELDAVASCEDTDSCEHSFIGSGCTDSPLPCCGFAHRANADLSTLKELDASYLGQNCGGNALACCSCAVPPSLECIDGVCAPQ